MNVKPCRSRSTRGCEPAGGTSHTALLICNPNNWHKHCWIESAWTHNTQPAFETTEQQASLFSQPHALPPQPRGLSFACDRRHAARDSVPSQEVDYSAYSNAPTDAQHMAHHGTDRFRAMPSCQSHPRGPKSLPACSRSSRHPGVRHPVHHPTAAARHARRHGWPHGFPRQPRRRCS